MTLAKETPAATAWKHAERLPLLAADAVAAGQSSVCSLRFWKAKLRFVQNDSRLLGMLLVACSAFTFSIMSTLIKFASFSMPSMETVFWRSFIAWLFNLVRVCALGTAVELRTDAIVPCI